MTYDSLFNVLGACVVASPASLLAALGLPALIGRPFGERTVSRLTQSAVITGLFAAIGVLTLIVTVGIGIGATVAGGDVATPIVGTLVIGIYALALCGIGMAVGGLVRTSWAGEVVALLVIVTFLIDLVVPAMQWPEWIHQLALTSHLGHPMVGLWDGPGMVLCLVLAIGGIALGALGMRRRDVVR